MMDIEKDKAFIRKKNSTVRGLYSSAAMAVLMAASLAACGGGGGSSGGGNQQGSGEEHDSELEFVVTLKNGSLFDLLAVPPSSPGGAEVISGLMGVSLGMWPRVFVTGKVVNGNIEGIARKAVFYGRENGSLWRTRTDANSFPPAPSEVSSADDANHSCWDSVRKDRNPVDPQAEAFQQDSLPSEVMPYADLTDIDNTPVVMAVKTQPSDPCQASVDTEWKYVRLGDDQTQSPRPFPEPDHASLTDIPMVSVRNTAGGYEGWLIKKDGDLIRWNEGQGSTIVQDGISDFSALGRRTDGSIYVQIDGSLKLYHPEDDQLESLNFQFKEDRETGLNRPANSIGDGNYLFFIEHHVGADPNDGSDDKIALYRASPDGTTLYSAEVTADFSSSYDLVLTKEFLVWHIVETASLSDTIRTYGKEDPSTRGPEVTGLQTYGEGFERGLFDVTDPTGDWIFYNQLDGAGGATALRLSDGHEVHFPSRVWLTGTLARERQAGFYRVVNSMLLAENAQNSSQLALTSIPAGHLESGDTYSALGMVDTGLTAGSSGILLFPYGYGEGRTGLLAEGGSSGGSSYVNLYWQPEQPGSLQALGQIGPGLPVLAY